MQQQLGDGIVRTIAMGTTDGLNRGLSSENTGEPIMFPLVKKPWVGLWMFWANPLMKQDQLMLKKSFTYSSSAPNFAEQAAQHRIIRNRN